MPEARSPDDCRPKLSEFDLVWVDNETYIFVVRTCSKCSKFVLLKWSKEPSKVVSCGKCGGGSKKDVSPKA